MPDAVLLEDIIKLEDITKVVVDLDLDRAAELLQRALAQGHDAGVLLDAMSQGMTEVGELFDQGEYFLADMVLAGETMKEGLRVIEPHLTVQRSGKKGCVVLCTVKGDVHDIGKNLVGNMLRSAGFEVVDLGVDVAESQVVEAVRRHGAQAVALSVLLTPQVPCVSAVVSALEAAGLRGGVKIAIGGACTTPELVERLGVDGMGRDPLEAVKLFESFM